ncbi:MAG: redoxin domain-containing protein [Flavobacteriales bacterium]|nr:redoxin domain-containing protein [Flavobacteriales bacterium]MCB9448834.1 redoxin domain-containing protein [Flavobacteriales bacterium]
MLHRFLLLTTLLLSLTCGAQTVIEGSAPEYKGKTVYFRTYGEQLLFNEETLGEAKVDATGHFKTDLLLLETTAVFIDVDGTRKLLHAEKNIHYNVEIHAGRDMNGDPVPMKILKEGPSKLNEKIRDFDGRYAAFRKKNLNVLNTEKGPEVVKEFLAEVNKEAIASQLPYYKTYVTYETAELYMLEEMDNRKFIQAYFTDRPVYPNHISYMYAFNNAFKTYLPELLVSRKSKSLWPPLLDRKLNAFLDSLGKDPLLKSPELREWVTLKGMISLYATPNSDKPMILSMISQFYNRKVVHTTNKAAGLIYRQLNKSVEDEPLPDINMTDLTGSAYTWEDAAHRPTYIMFMVTTDPKCVGELELLKSYHESYGTLVRFVAVSLDESEQAYRKLAERSKPEFDFVHASDPKKVAELYNLPVLPQYIMADEQKKIVHAGAPSPAERLHEFLLPYVRKK